MTDYFLIAKIDSVYSEAGFLRITSYSDFPERFFTLKKVYLNFFGEMKEFKVESVKDKGSSFIIKFKNFDSSSDCELLIGKEVFIESKNVVKLPKDNYFIHDLVGSEVFRNGKLIGKIVDVLQMPANDVYVIESPGKKEILIPALKKLIEKFDVENKKMILTPGDDLYENEN